MKTINQIREEISEVTEAIQTTELKPAQKTKLVNRILWLRNIILYLETNPTEQFLRSEVKILQDKITRRKDHIPKDIMEPAVRRSFENDWNIPHLKEQLNTINYILE